MTNKEKANYFKQNKIAINCKTENEVNDFFLWCLDNEILWNDSKKYFFEYFKEETCYFYCIGNIVYFGYKKWFENSDYDIIDFNDFMKF